MKSNSPAMLTQQRTLQDKLEEYGWHRVEPPDMPLDWWADDVWLLQSIWSPQECEVFLTFIVDPLWSRPRANGQGVWQITASLDNPVHNSSVRLILGRHWQERLPSFFADLSTLRGIYQKAIRP